MKNKQFWLYQCKFFLPITIAYLLFLGLLGLLAILYYLPKGFFIDTIRFTIPFFIVWFLIDAYRTAIQVKKIEHGRQAGATNPVEFALRQVAVKQRQHDQRVIRHLHNRQQEQLDHVELYSHEIKNALTSLQAAAENGPTIPSRDVRTAVHQADYQLDMLLSDERLAMTNHDFSFEWIDLTALITSILKQNSAVFIHHQLLPSLTGLTGVRVLTDRKWLRFCINQLLSNAIKYSADGATITFRWAANSLSIIDTGEGISSADLPRIFDNGFSGKNGHQTTKSTGMGLYLVKKVCAQLNFSLTVTSKQGNGTQAILHFPADNVKVN